MPSGLTLLEAAAYMTDPARVGVIQSLADGNPLLEVLPFHDIQGTTLPYNQQAKAPTMAFRGINEGYADTVGLLNPQTEMIKPFGGVNRVDRVLTMSDSTYRRTQDEMFFRELGRKYAATFFEGDIVNNMEEFDGLKGRLQGGQLKSAGTAANGVSMNSTAGLDALEAGITEVDGTGSATIAIFMSEFLIGELTKFTRNNSNHQVEWAMSDIGKRVRMWNGYQIRSTDGGDDPTQDPLISVTEPDSPAGAENTTSVYIVRFSADGQYLRGLQNDSGIFVNAEPNPRTHDDGKLKFVTAIEWVAGLQVSRARAACRIRHYKTTV